MLRPGRATTGRSAAGRSYGVGRNPQHHQGLWRDRGDPRRRHRHRRRRVRRPGRAVGLRKVDAAAHGRGAGEHHLRRNPHRRAGGEQPAAEGARHRHGVPELRALSAHDGRRQHELLDAAARRAEGGDRGAGQARRRNPRARPLSRPVSAATLRRPAPARRHGPRHRPRSAGVFVRRAAVEPRRQTARADAHRDQGAAPAAQDHDDLRHPRPDRGHDHGRQDRGDARRPGRADRRAARTVRPARQSVRRGLHRLAGDEFPARHDPRERRGLVSTGRRRPSAARDGASGRRRPRRGVRHPARAFHPGRRRRRSRGPGDRADRLGDAGRRQARRPRHHRGVPRAPPFEAGRQDPAQTRSEARPSVRRGDRANESDKAKRRKRP